MNSRIPDARNFAIYLLCVGAVPHFLIRHGKIEESIALAFVALIFFILESHRKQASNYFSQKWVHGVFGCTSLGSFSLCWISFKINGAGSLLSLGWIDIVVFSVSIFGYFVALNDAAQNWVIARRRIEYKIKESVKIKGSDSNGTKLSLILGL